MARNKQKAAGGKVTKAHCSVIDAAQPIVKAAQRHPDVVKISLSIIEQVGKTSTMRIKCQRIDAGLRVVGRGSTTTQEIWVYCAAEAQERVQAALEAAFN